MNQEQLKRCWSWCKQVLYDYWNHLKLQDYPQDVWMHQLGASFVTFKSRGELRGCIGTIHAVEPLYRDLQKNTIASATRDPRFSPITPQERFSLSMEVSILSEPQPLELKGRDLIDYLTKHPVGLILQHHERRATFLPQVWEDLPQPEMFLRRLSMKAGLDSEAWKSPDTEFLFYTVDHYSQDLEGR